MSILERSSWTTPVDFIISDIIEYDMKRAGLSIIRENKFSRLPVYQGEKNNIVGFLDVRRYIKTYLANPASISVRRIMSKVMTVQDTQLLDDLLEKMTQSRTHICAVKDKDGVCTGIVTMEDILEQLVGEIYDEDDIIPASYKEQEGWV